jgi:hypothetical protein
VQYEQTCPRCGEAVVGEDKELVTDAVIDHAHTAHDHPLDRNVVLAHLEGVNPHEREP